MATEYIHIGDFSPASMLAYLSRMFIYLLFSTLLGLLAFASLNTHKQKLAPKAKLTPPTVSLLIPVRDEGDKITNTLHQALGLDYPKLEIIALDDNSSDNTIERIRSFAQDGVRFVSGTEPQPHWTGKNWALHQLAREASGDYIVFCDSSVILRSRSFNRIVHRLVTGEAQVVSILPQLIVQSKFALSSMPLLHWLIRLSGKITTPHVGAFGGLMAFNKEAYFAHGGYERYKTEILAELKISRDFARKGNYQLLRSSQDSALLIKSPSALIESRVRYLYPLYTRFTALGLGHAFLALLPLLILSFTPWLYPVLLIVFWLTARELSNHPVVAAILLPISCFVDIFLLPVSAYRHRKGEVRWKNRPVN